MLQLIKKCTILFTLCGFLFFLPQQAKAWEPEGHTIIVKIAMQFLTPDARKNVLDVLGAMSPDSAANWMDIMRANSDYDFMKPWHYIDFGKDQQYTPSMDENIVNRIILTLNELKHKKLLCRDQVRTDLLILLHLTGDLSQPLHTGYDDDLGGNKLALQFDTLKTNLHKFWDEDIIRLSNISLQDCLDLYKNNAKTDSIDRIDPISWMKESRSLLPFVYSYDGSMPNSGYFNNSKLMIVRQLLVAGLRLAAILNKLFISDTPELNMKEVAAKYKGIEAKDALNYIGKKQTVCGRVYGIKVTDKVTFINVGDKYPNAPLTVVVFAKDRKNFPLPIEELFADKNICVKGTIVEYQSRAEIIITDPADIFIISQ